MYLYHLTYVERYLMILVFQFPGRLSSFISEIPVLTGVFLHANRKRHPAIENTDYIQSRSTNCQYAYFDYNFALLTK
jgi:hypothetical protein